MTTWRETTSAQAQDDVDGLFDQAFTFAEQQLSARGEFYPFGFLMAADGVVRATAADTGHGDHPSAADLLDGLYEAARRDASLHRAAAFGVDVLAEGSTAVRIELEHAEGLALTVLVPYRRSRLRRTVTFGQMSFSAGTPRTWTLA